ncbi:hypothetical protein [Candidatus Amarobacter glycogenicus]|uniref:hypothetical protein n=1 Tax=Candidatus Amarobacter glycogenicus TaxID=3140699 RepID=UPI0031CC8030
MSRNWPVFVKFLNIRSFFVADVKISLRIDEQPLRVQELPILRAMTPPLVEELTVTGELLYAVVQGIRDVNISLGIGGHTSVPIYAIQEVELACLCSFIAPCGEEIAVRVEFDNALVVAVYYIEVSLPIETDLWAGEGESGAPP